MTPPKVRIYDLARTLNLSNKDLITLLEKHFNLNVKSHSSSIDQPMADKLVAIVKQEAEAASQPRVRVTRLIKAAPPPTSAAPAPQAPDTTPAPATAPIESQAAPAAATPAPVSSTPETPPADTTPRVQPASPPVIQPAILTPPPRPEIRTLPPHQGRKPLEPPLDPSRAPRRLEQAPHPLAPPRSSHPASPPGMARPPFRPEGRPHPAAPPRAPMAGPSLEGAPPPADLGAPGSPDARRKGALPEKKDEKRERERHEPLEKLIQPGRKDGRMHHRGSSPEEAVDETPKEVVIDAQLTVSELALLLNARETDIIKHVFMKGVMVTVNQTLDPTFAKSIARELGYEVKEAEKTKAVQTEYSSTDAVDKREKLDVSQYKHLKTRPPVVSIMGHVDHGKTSLLDAIRQTRHKIVDSEAGGITQSIGAYTVEKDGQRVVFLDTPGHEAFTAMRMRGARATDIAVLVVAADDGVMPQTIEAINHAKAAKIPIIIAVNKMDRAAADADRVLTQLIDHGLMAEDWGGDTLVARVSAIQQTGLDDLLDKILLVSELLELKADATVAAEGVIIEAQLDKQRGPLVNALVQNGLLRVGDNILIGPVGGRVRALINDYGERVREAGPSSPVEILGMPSVPNAGDSFRVIRDDKAFRQILSEERQRERDNRLERRQIIPGLTAPMEDDSLDDVSMNFIVKADTQGSTEAVNDALSALNADEITIKIIHSGTGDISEADVMLASASQAMIIGFNVREDQNAAMAADRAGVKIRKYDVIYHIAEEIEKVIVGQLSPETIEVEKGRAEVRELFTAGKRTIAGCMVTDGKVQRNASVRIFRGSKEIFRGAVANLKRFKEDVKEVAAGYECGITVDGFDAFEAGDQMAFVVTEFKKRTSDSIKRSGAANAVS
ncbi:MAG: translation initiation factor IF-2 [Vampirovibrionales bacterium]|nr:translation initiation factor IF-2 [Vampirovibrionales bacterium]